MFLMIINIIKVDYKKILTNITKKTIITDYGFRNVNFKMYENLTCLINFNLIYKLNQVQTILLFAILGRYSHLYQ